MTDNEAAQRAAYFSEFGGIFYYLPLFDLSSCLGAVQHKTCYFHFTQAIFKRLRKLQLMAAYNTSVPFVEFIRMLMSLALIPLQHVDDAYDYLESRLGEFTENKYRNLAKFFAYFRKVCLVVDITVVE